MYIFLWRKRKCLFKPVWWCKKGGPPSSGSQGLGFIGVRKVEAKVQGKRLVWGPCSLVDPLGCFVCVFPVFSHDPYGWHVPNELRNRSALLVQEELNVSSPCLNPITGGAAETHRHKHKSRTKTMWQEVDHCNFRKTASKFTFMWSVKPQSLCMLKAYLFV